MAELNVEVQNGAEKNGLNGNGATEALSFFSLKPQLLVQAPKAADAVTFYKEAFCAVEVKRDMHPKRKADQEIPLILSAELKIGSSLFIVSDHFDDSLAPVVTNGTGCTFCLETNDVEAAVAKAVKAGAAAAKPGKAVNGTEAAEVEGDAAACGVRSGAVKDVYGFTWCFCKVAAEVAA